jgi:hypothetical protein
MFCGKLSGNTEEGSQSDLSGSASTVACNLATLISGISLPFWSVRRQLRLRLSLLLAVFFSFTLLLGVSSNVASAALSTQGYAEYKLALATRQIEVASFVLNESAQPTNQNGIVLVTLALVSGVRNLTYSRALNTSSPPEVFPYLFGLTNQSLSYRTSGLALTVHIVKTGIIPVTFKGKSYEGTDYQISASAEYALIGNPVSTKGSIVTMPSGLIYSMELLINSTSSAQAQLLATSLPLANPGSGTWIVGVALVGTGLVGAAAFAVPTVFKRVRGKPGESPAVAKEPERERKPSYWVD